MIKTTRKDQRGSAALIILVLLILVAVGSIGWWMWHKNHKSVAHVTTAVVACSTSNLQLSTGHEEGAAGTIYMHAILTNKGTAKCKLGGYPAVFLADSHGTVLGGGAESNSLYTPVSITLAPGAAAHAVLGFPQAGNFDPGICSAASTTLRMYPPGSISAVETALSQHSCPGFSVTALQTGE